MTYSWLKSSYPDSATTKTGTHGAGSNNTFNSGVTQTGFGIDNNVDADLKAGMCKTPVTQDVGTERVLLMFQKEFGNDYTLVNHPGLPLSNNSWMLSKDRHQQYQHSVKSSGVLPSVLTNVTGVIRENNAVYGGFRYLTSWSTPDLEWFYVILEKSVNKENVTANGDCRAEKVESDAKAGDSRPASDWDAKYVELETVFENRHASRCHSSWGTWSPTLDTANVNDNTDMRESGASAIRAEWEARPPTPFEVAPNSAAANHDPSVSEKWDTESVDCNEWERQSAWVERKADSVSGWNDSHENECLSESNFDNEWANTSCVDDNASTGADTDGYYYHDGNDLGDVFPNDDGSYEKRGTETERNEDHSAYFRDNEVESHQGPRLVRASRASAWDTASVGNTIPTGTMSEHDPVYRPCGWEGICSPASNPYLRAAASKFTTAGTSGPCKRVKRETPPRTGNMGTWGRRTSLTPTSNCRASPVFFTPTASWREDYNNEKNNEIYSEWDGEYLAQPSSAGGCDATSSLNVNTGHNRNNSFNGVDSYEPGDFPKVEDSW